MIFHPATTAAQHAAAAHAARCLIAHAITEAARRIADRQAQREEKKDE
jgi:hypothetical protein